MNRIWAAYTETFKTIVTHSTLLTTLILSVLFYSVFYPVAYQAEHAESLPIIVVDEEHSVLTQSIIHHVAKSPNVEIRRVTISFLEAQQQVENQQAAGILLLPENLSQSIRHGEPGGIGLYLSATNFLSTKQIGLGLASSIENTLTEYAEPFGQISEFSPALSIHSIPLFNPLSGYGSYIFPAVAPLIVHQTILLGLSILLLIYRDQQIQFTLSRVAGLSLAILTIGIFGCLYLFGFAFWLFDYPRGGNFWGMLLAVPVYIYCLFGITLLFASFLDMPERVGHIVVFSSIPLFMLSGVAWPHSAMPVWLGFIATWLPSTQAIQLFIQLNQMGVTTDLVIPKLLYLFFIGSLCLYWGYRRFQTPPSMAQ